MVACYLQMTIKHRMGCILPNTTFNQTMCLIYVHLKYLTVIALIWVNGPRARPKQPKATG